MKTKKTIKREKDRERAAKMRALTKGQLIERRIFLTPEQLPLFEAAVAKFGPRIYGLASALKALAKERARARRVAATGESLPAIRPAMPKEPEQRKSKKLDHSSWCQGELF
ncbi:hypothetical protein [Actomonas aquatica]|uniref:Uncharacterized protein n=1 Tax=Actomonas aquatica TaxID=2866162 RepID=A0ABZ1C5D4_9BACT|nr:hypothetical protein [Opitutus sp. WL0086]WRQ85734.1 hypothetical protein K1X11_013060 [Opitutus sp. WL0086]